MELRDHQVTLDLQVTKVETVLQVTQVVQGFFHSTVVLRSYRKTLRLQTLYTWTLQKDTMNETPDVQDLTANVGRLVVPGPFFPSHVSSLPEFFVTL